MKEGTAASGSYPCRLLASSTADELIVAQILLDLRYRVDIVESLPGSKWGRKRRRSCLSQGASSSLAPRTDAAIEERKPSVKAEEVSAAAATATASPVTPLAFSPSESEGKSAHTVKKSFKKRSREDYIDMIEELTERRDLLRKEIENVTNYYKKLTALNSQLKAAKQEVLNSCPMKEEPSRGMNVGLESNHYPQTSVATHPQPLVPDRMAGNFLHSSGPFGAQIYSSNNGLGSVNHVGLLGIPDLNMSASEAFGNPSQPLDVSRELADRRARFAEARRRRRGLIKTKSTRKARGPR